MSIVLKPPTDVIIIGAGLSGLTTSCQLKNAFNLDNYCIYDRAEDIGGTWWANKYPGCAVDIPGICYSFSFSPNYEFSKLFPPRQEILDYIRKVAAEHEVQDHFTGCVEWKGAYWQDYSNIWLVELQDLRTGQVMVQECKILISGVGGVVDPNKFHMPGMEKFQGDIVHTARWKDDLDLKDKHVVVVGNGSSAVQLVPAIIDKTKSINQFMRTPHHLMPAQNYDIPPAWRTAFRWVPGLLLLARLLMFLYLESAFFQFTESGTGEYVRRKSESLSFNHVQQKAPRKYWSLLMPTYKVGCKRRVFDHSYADCLGQDKIRLTDDSITSLKPKSVVTKSGDEVAADVVILATGFALTQYDTHLQGRNGRTRSQHWKESGYKGAYQSVAMYGFPNFFYVMGPNSGRSHTSQLLSIENYVDMIISVIRPIIQKQAAVVEVKPDSEQRYNEALHMAIDKTVHDNSCGSFFIDGKTGKNWFTYPWDSVRLWVSTHWDYKGDWMYSS